MSRDFTIKLSAPAQKRLRKLDKTQYGKRIREAIDLMETNPLAGDVKELKNMRRATHRKRIGPYRILFELDLNRRAIRIHSVKHRKDAYRMFTFIF